MLRPVFRSVLSQAIRKSLGLTGSGGGGPGPAPLDPLWYAVEFLMVEGADASDVMNPTAFNGDQALVSDQPLFRGSNIYGSRSNGSSCLQVTTSASADVGDGDFTLEWWQYSAGGPVSSAQAFSFADNSLDIDYINGRYTIKTSGGNLTQSTRHNREQRWMHFVVERHNGTTRFYLDGVPDGEADLVYDFNPNAVGGFRINGGTTSNYAWMEDFRYTKLARYQGNAFEVPTEGYPIGQEGQIFSYYPFRGRSEVVNPDPNWNPGGTSSVRFLVRFVRDGARDRLLGGGGASNLAIGRDDSGNFEVSGYLRRALWNGESISSGDPIPTNEWGVLDIGLTANAQCWRLFGDSNGANQAHVDLAWFEFLDEEDGHTRGQDYRFMIEDQTHNIGNDGATFTFNAFTTDRYETDPDMLEDAPLYAGTPDYDSTAAPIYYGGTTGEVFINVSSDEYKAHALIPNATSYQWEWSDDEVNWDNSGWSGNNTEVITLDPTSSTTSGRRYRCKGTNANGVVYSEYTILVKMAGDEIYPYFTEISGDVTVPTGTTAVFTAIPKYEDTIQWQYRNSGSSLWFPYADKTEETLEIPSDDPYYLDGTSFRCVATGPAGPTTSPVMTLTIT